MFGSSPTSRISSMNIRSRPSTPAGSGRNSDSNKEGSRFDSKTTMDNGLHRNDLFMAALHESRDEEEEEESNDAFIHENDSNNGHKQQHSVSRAVPGRATRQRRRRKRSNSIWPSLFLPGKPAGKTLRQLLFQSTPSRPLMNGVRSGTDLSTLVLAVALWYSLGVISISTSKLLLLSSSHSMEEMGEVAYYKHVGGLAPVLLTLQQLLLGSIFLRFFLTIQCLQSPGVQPLDSLCGGSPLSASSSRPNSSIFQTYVQLLQHTDARYLCFAGFCFSLGFYCTNVGFQASSAAFVETIKASEPITSAVLAVAWGLEMVNRKEATSLAMIVCGVILSTLGNSPPSTTADDYGGTNADADAGLGMVASLLSCGIVMMSNLCFSFRGLFQKLFQKRSNQSILMDDLNLQYRMQQMGVLVFAVPAVLWEGRSVLEHIYRVSSHVGLMQSGVLIHYVGLASVNAVAFASYNLASTYLLSRISVVQHAALNCIRRIFAIVVTSIIFANPISTTGGLGILISFGGFMSFTHAKAQKQRGGNTSLLPLAKSHP